MGCGRVVAGMDAGVSLIWGEMIGRGVQDVKCSH